MVVTIILGVSEFRVCLIWAFVIPRFFKFLLESLWLIWLLDVRLFIYTNLVWASLSSWSMCTLLMYACRLRIAPVWVLVGTLGPR
jgi:hypothetical protein